MNVLEKILEEIIDELKEDGVIADNERGHRAIEIIRSHMDEAKDANIPSNDDWIPVEERLPSDEIGEVLTQNRQEYMLIGYFSYNENMGWYECESDEALLTDVVAWRPLMEPYRPKEKNNE